MLSLFNLGPHVTMDSRDDGAFTQGEADVTLIAYTLRAALFGKCLLLIGMHVLNGSDMVSLMSLTVAVNQRGKHAAPEL